MYLESSLIRSAAARLLGSNPTGGMDVCLLWVSCVVW